MRLLLVEDEDMLREGLEDVLTAEGHAVVAVADGVSAVERGQAEQFDLVILDWMLPRMEGTEVCRRLRLARPTVPVLMLTARGAESDKVEGLDAGADDYVTKPFGVKELLARVRVWERRRAQAPSPPEIVLVDGARIDLGRCVVARDGGDDVELTAREVGLLRWLYQHRARVVSRAELLEHVWGLSPKVETRTIDVTIGNLRKKVERDPATPAVIVSVKGVGYAWGGDG
ncbi:MAG: response regulator transcription factor [Deltaproteobacteria bacterium]|nr:response regulator transcription factor [Deltaproteobacteria bacterium]